jgi:hypothetical protein
MRCEARQGARRNCRKLDGSKTATLSLLGNTVTSDLALTNDLHGGTFVGFV